jgi:hypothetical protein
VGAGENPPEFGEVLGVGPKVEDDRIEPGTVVVFNKHIQNAADYGTQGKIHFIHEDDLFAVVSREGGAEDGLDYESASL